ncbi:DUF3459 domain-containing protein [Pseudonocardia sp. H11422]|uniref:DUF3459 domain-containing protein n=1 Tax=Pseudonocardia sp. H11422 TaxID=2835866 RepID=UPI0027E37DF2|nr:DUF3459 domain-containing protein [Pseudonocardia sp. H11422]
MNPNHVTINAAVQRDDPGSVLAHYRRLIDLRHKEPAVTHGHFTLLLPDDRCVYAFTRLHRDTELVVLGNFTADTVGVPDAAPWAATELVIGNHPPPRDHGELRPWEARVYRRTLR